MDDNCFVTFFNIHRCGGPPLLNEAQMRPWFWLVAPDQNNYHSLLFFITPKGSTKITAVRKYKLLCPRGAQTCALAVANIKVNGNGKVILDTHPESDQHQN